MTNSTPASDVLTQLRASLARIEAGESTPEQEVPATQGPRKPTQDKGVREARRGSRRAKSRAKDEQPRGGQSGDGRSGERERRKPASVAEAKDPYAVARAIVLRQLSNAPKSRQQLRDALAKRECPDEVADAVLDRMTEVGLVDDEAYAQILVRSMQGSRGLAKRALSEELRKKGIDADLATSVLDEIEPSSERATARRLVDKKLATMHGLDVTVQTRRLAGMLARKGYPGDIAWGVIRDAIADAPEHQRD